MSCLRFLVFSLLLISSVGLAEQGRFARAVEACNDAIVGAWNRYYLRRASFLWPAGPGAVTRFNDMQFILEHRRSRRELYWLRDHTDTNEEAEEALMLGNSRAYISLRRTHSHAKAVEILQRFPEMFGQ